MVKANASNLKEFGSLAVSKDAINESNAEARKRSALCACTNFLIDKIPESTGSPLLMKLIRFHARTCKGCRENLEAMLLVSDFLASQSVIPAPSELAGIVMGNIENLLEGGATQKLSEETKTTETDMRGLLRKKPESPLRSKKALISAVTFAAVTLGFFIGWLIRYLFSHGVSKNKSVGQSPALAGTK